MTIQTNGINFQDPLRSTPVDDNFNIQTSAINDLQSQIDNITTPASGSEVSNARDYHDALRDRIRSNSDGIGNILISGGVISESGTPDMNINISDVVALVSGVGIDKTSITPIAITAPVSDTRLDYVVVNADNTISVISGTPSATPVFPNTSSLVIGCLVVKSTTTSLNDGTEIFNFINGSNPYFPNVYVNANYTATDKSHNNVIVDDGATVTGTLECQGNCFLVDCDNSGSDGSGQTVVSLSTPPIGTGTIASYSSSTTWTLWNASNDGSSGFGTQGTAQDGSSSAYLSNQQYDAIVGNSGNNGTAFTCKAYNIYITSLSTNGGVGASGSATFDPNTYVSAFPVGDFSVGVTGRNGSDASDITLSAIDTIEIISGGSTTLNGGDGGDGADASDGTVGNLGGDSGDAGDAGTFTYTSKTFTNNGTLTYTAGSIGSVGVGSGGSDNNGNGTAGASGSPGATDATLYDFTTGIVSGYADWVHPLYMTREINV